MLAQLRANLLLLGLTLLFCAVIYPLSLLAVGAGVFPDRARGSLIQNPEGAIIGSRLIAQEFKGDEWFQPRPSAVGYTANASGGSNLSPNNPKLRERVEEIVKSRGEKTGIPADAVTASGSGLDPHITLVNARGQLDRVVAAWVAKTKKDASKVRMTIEAVLSSAAFLPLGGLIGGEELINVLEVNVELQRKLGETSK